MSLARIPFPTLETMTPDQRRVYDAVVSGPRGEIKGPLLAALHRPELADKWQQFGELLRFRTSVRPRHTELAILVTARCCDCQFEWLAHEGPALQAGLDPADLDAIRTLGQPAFADSEDTAVHDFAMQLQKTKMVDDGAYQKVLDIYGTVGVVELTAVIGYYTMVAMTLNTHQFPLPANVAAPF
jgi:4-carboxymuconolactone decarboxylase